MGSDPFFRFLCFGVILLVLTSFVAKLKYWYNNSTGVLRGESLRALRAISDR